eukprot:scaffold20544_cov31-Tisochrysis_lutea.AAC.2
MIELWRQLAVLLPAVKARQEVYYLENSKAPPTPPRDRTLKMPTTANRATPRRSNNTNTLVPDSVPIPLPPVIPFSSVFWGGVPCALYWEGVMTQTLFK